MRFLVAIFLAFISTCLLAQSKPVTVSVGDRLSVAVVGFKEYSGEYEVASDGTISGPGFGIVSVEGKTLQEVTKIVTDKFKAVIRDPEVFVGLEMERPKVVYLVGIPSVLNPSVPVRGVDQPKLPTGSVPLLPDTTLRALLAGATFGDRPDLYEGLVVRNGTTFKTIDIDKLLHGDTGEFDGPFEPNDVVIVRPKARVKIWLVGAFRQPGDHMVPEGVTIDQAISGSGGIDSTSLPQGPGLGAAILSRALIQLRRGGEVTDLKATAGASDLSQTVEAGDTLTLVLPKLLNVSIAGYVMHPGEVSVDSTAGALAAVSAAGGPDPRGGLGNVILYRGSEMTRLDLSPTEPAAPKFQLENNDLLYVSENRRFIQVLGSVRNPGVVYLPDDKREIRASEALSKANGLMPEGSLRRAVLVRPGKDGKYRVVQQFNLDEFLKDGHIDANPIVQPGDVLFFGTPKGLSSQGLIQLVSAAAVLYSVGFRL